jgi:myo-inositol 2-dehydrogenase / D-chiro-inositol 1-dehydrogenase
MADGASGGKFRLGLVGAGRMGRTHLRALAGSADIRVVAVAEPAAAAREAACGLAGGASGHASVGEMLDAAAGGMAAGRVELDGVLICAPTDQHLDVVRDVAAAGWPILCEKPCGVSSAQARAAAEAAAAAGVPFQAAYWRRYVPALRAVREQLLGGELGAIHLVSCQQWDEAPPAPVFRAHSGGIFVDMGVHEFDQLRWLTGQEIVGLTAAVVVGDAPAGDVDSAQALARLSGGGVGFVSLGRHHPVGDMVRAEVFGTRGSVRCDVIDPRDGEAAQLVALAAQAADFAALARSENAAGGAMAADAVAALEAAERAAAAVPELAAAAARAAG